jgi:hypothetical protein
MPRNDRNILLVDYVDAAFRSQRLPSQKVVKRGVLVRPQRIVRRAIRRLRRSAPPQRPRPATYAQAVDPSAGLEWMARQDHLRPIRPKTKPVPLIPTRTQSLERIAPSGHPATGQWTLVQRRRRRASKNGQTSTKASHYTDLDRPDSPSLAAYRPPQADQPVAAIPLPPGSPPTGASRPPRRARHASTDADAAADGPPLTLQMPRRPRMASRQKAPFGAARQLRPASQDSGCPCPLTPDGSSSPAPKARRDSSEYRAFLSLKAKFEPGRKTKPSGKENAAPDLTRTESPSGPCPDPGPPTSPVGAAQEAEITRQKQGRSGLSEG